MSDMLTSNMLYIINLQSKSLIVIIVYV